MRTVSGKVSKRTVAFFAIAMTSLNMAPRTSHAAPLQRNGIEWSDNIDQAIVQSQQLNKPMLLKVSTDWCGYCKKMQRETFSDAGIMNQISANFIPVYVDGDKHKALIQQLGVRTFPTTLVVAPNRQVLANITGFRNAQQLSNDLAKISAPQGQQPTEQAIAKTPSRYREESTRQSIFGRNCPVSPIEMGRFVEASGQFTTSFRGYKVGFASQEYLDAFLQNPVKYWPVADGHCIVTAAHGQGRKMGVLSNGALYQGRIWFFADQQSKIAFEAEPSKYLNWLKQRTQLVAKQKASRPRR